MALGRIVKCEVYNSRLWWSMKCWWITRNVCNDEIWSSMIPIFKPSCDAIPSHSHTRLVHKIIISYWPSPKSFEKNCNISLGRGRVGGAWVGWAVLEQLCKMVLHGGRRAFILRTSCYASLASDLIWSPRQELLFRFTPKQRSGSQSTIAMNQLNL